ncbi:MAG: PEGA domain-containing protein [Polyangiales bacterium]
MAEAPTDDPNAVPSADDAADPNAENLEPPNAEAADPDQEETVPEITSPTKTSARKLRRQRVAAAPEAPSAAVGSGKVNVVTQGGWAEIYLKGQKLGTTPRKLTLPAGTHRLQLMPFGEGPAKTVSVTIVADTTKKVSVTLD